MGYFRSWHHFLLLDNIEKFKKNLCSVLNTFTFENIIENGAFATNEQMLLFPKYLQIPDISKPPKGVIME